MEDWYMQDIFRRSDEEAAAFYTSVREKRAREWRQAWDAHIALVKEARDVGILDGIAEATGQEIHIIPSPEGETISYPPNEKGLGLAALVSLPNFDQPWDETVRVSIHTRSMEKPVVLSYQPKEGLVLDGQTLLPPANLTPHARPQVANVTRGALQLAMGR